MAAQIPLPRPSEPKVAYSFAFRDADLAAVAEEVLGHAIGVSYVVDPSVTAKISYRIDQSLTKLELLASFEAALSAYDIVLVRSGEAFTVTSRTRARALVTPGGGGGGPGGYSTVSITLEHAKPTEVAKALKAMGGPDVVVFTDDQTGVIMLGGTPREIAGARQALQALDRRVSVKSRWIDLKNASADVISRELEQILKALNLSSVQIAAIPRLRGMMLFAPNDSALDEAEQIITRLDVTSAAGEEALWYYRPKNVAAESLSSTLNRVLGNTSLMDEPTAPLSGRPETTPSGLGGPSSIGAGPLQPSARPSREPTTPSLGVSGASSVISLGEDQTRVAVDRESNTLVIHSPPYRKAELTKLLEELDVRPRQVLIEASVLEVGLTEELRLGVDWSIINGRSTVTSTGERTAVVAPAFPGLAVTYLSADVDAAIDALGSKTSVEVISSPKIIVLDNRSARLQIGDQVPVVTQTAQSIASEDSPRLVSIEYRNTGVILDVTPRVTGDGAVTILISQEVSAVARTTTSGIDSPTIQQRRFDSSLLLNSGGTVALGGLISENRNRGSSGVPVLMNIPFLGTLFKNEGADARRTELIVLLSATILADPEETAKATSELSSRMGEIEGRDLPNR